MPPLVVPQGVLVRLLWSKGGTTTAINVLGARNATGAVINQTLTNTLGSSIKSAVTSSGLGALQGTTFALAQVGVRNIAIANQPEFLDTGAAVAGSGTGDYLPPQVSFAVTLRTALAGRRYRGRTYLTGFVEAASDANGVATSGTATAAVAFITAVQSAMATSGLTLAVVSRVLSITEPVTAIVSRDLLWETQRRRALAGV